MNEIHNYGKKYSFTKYTLPRALTKSKTPIPENLDASTVQPLTETQKKAPKVVPTNDLDSDDEEGKEKVLLENPKEEKATKKKKERTDLQKATLLKLRGAVVGEEENKNMSGKTVSFSFSFSAAFDIC